MDNLTWLDACLGVREETARGVVLTFPLIARFVIQFNGGIFPLFLHTNIYLTDERIPRCTMMYNARD